MIKGMIHLARHSLSNRRLTTTLTIASIALSIALFLGVERVRQSARDSFSNTISQTDLIVGAKGGTIQLLLYAVFRMGSATNNISWESYEHWRKDPRIEWTIPYSLGDSHRGFRVVGTDDSFYQHYRYRRDRNVTFQEGQKPEGIFDVVLGADVAKKLNYKVGQKIVIAHGVTKEGEAILQHDDKPFVITGILVKTGTPIDRSVYVTLYGMEAIHVDWADGAPPMAGKEVPADSLKKDQLKVGQITAFLLRTKSRIETLQLQRDLNTFDEEPLMAIIPGVALAELWDGISYAEDGLRVVSAFVVLVGLMGMLVALYNSLNERRREMAILRAVGAGPYLIASLLMTESLLLTIAGSFWGILIIYSGLYVTQPFIEAQFGLYIPIRWPEATEYMYIGAVWFFALILGLIPAIRAYRNTLTDGLSIRV